MTISALVTAARDKLRVAGIAPDDADLSARLLAQEVLGWDAAHFLTASGSGGPPDFAERYERLVARRAGREPLAYITGQREFWSLSFEVSPAVLIPRPETELLLETALDLCPDRSAALTIADVGTGSGCLAVSLAREYPAARVVASDVSSRALEVARRNALRHGVADRIEFVQTDLLTAVPDRFDLIVANPPYIPDREQATLQPEVRDYEPAMALFGGSDGLTVIRKLLEQSAARLKSGGILAFEFGDGQAAAVSSLTSSVQDLILMGLWKDLQGIPRAAIARRAP
jgi:release factor glutamine methyltransferase